MSSGYSQLYSAPYPVRETSQHYDAPQSFSAPYSMAKENPMYGDSFNPASKLLDEASISELLGLEAHHQPPFSAHAAPHPRHPGYPPAPQQMQSFPEESSFSAPSYYFPQQQQHQHQQQQQQQHLQQQQQQHLQQQQQQHLQQQQQQHHQQQQQQQQHQHQQHYQHQQYHAGPSVHTSMPSHSDAAEYPWPAPAHSMHPFARTQSHSSEPNAFQPGAMYPPPSSQSHAPAAPSRSTSGHSLGDAAMQRAARQRSVSAAPALLAAHAATVAPSPAPSPAPASTSASAAMGMKSRTSAHTAREPQLNEFPSADEYGVAWTAWRQTRDSNNEAVRRSRMQKRATLGCRNATCLSMLTRLKLLHKTTALLLKATHNPKALTRAERRNYRAILAGLHPASTPLPALPDLGNGLEGDSDSPADDDADCDPDHYSCEHARECDSKQDADTPDCDGSPATREEAVM